MTEVERIQLRRDVCDLIASSGCSCCRDDEGWEAAQDKIGERLGVERYDDDSGWNWDKYRRKQ